MATNPAFAGAAGCVAVIPGIGVCGFAGDLEIAEDGPRCYAHRRTDRAGVRTCRVCGCTDDHACEGGCWWVDADLCSACSAPTVAETIGYDDDDAGRGWLNSTEAR
jgi:hypothetical protein